jgi:hypothetical protein
MKSSDANDSMVRTNKWFNSDYRDYTVAYMKAVDEAGFGLGLIVVFGIRGVQRSGSATTVQFRYRTLLLSEKIYSIIRGGTINQIVADVPSGLSLILPQEIN